MKLCTVAHCGALNMFQRWSHCKNRTAPKMTLATCVWKVCCWDKMRLGKTGDLIAMATHLQWHDSAVEQMTLERWVTMSIFLVLVWSNHEGVGSYLWKSCRILRILKQPLLHKYVIRNDQDDFGFLNRIIITEQPNLLNRKKTLQRGEKKTGNQSLWCVLLFTLLAYC